ncbi:MAG: hypothetical protein IJ346_00195 [Clostridia bacterium]|nr:hypothetical protein [Clostridia bacterium]
MNQEEYKTLREMHTKAFGDTFEKAFEGNEQAQLLLSIALLKVSKGEFESAKPQFEMLESIAENTFDDTSIWYFKGLNYEFLKDEEKMSEYYERVCNSGITLTVGLVFFPYYRTAKLYQKASKAKKAMYYFSKALEIFEGRNITPATAKAVSQLLYEIATVHLYMHNYQECERFLKLSTDYNKSQNQQRDYVNAILEAIKGNAEKCNLISNTLENQTLKISCLKTTQAILEGTDLHYCKVTQERDHFEDFWLGFAQNEELIKNLILSGDTDSAAQSLSNVLSVVFEYVNRPVECEIEYNNGKITVKCKNYYIKTLKAEQTALFSQIPEKFKNWKFVSVEE